MIWRALRYRTTSPRNYLSGDQVLAPLPDVELLPMIVGGAVDGMAIERCPQSHQGVLHQGEWIVKITVSMQ
jgi:hypothetical protein